MISTQTLNQIVKLASPGITIYYSELNDIKDKKTVSDMNAEISKALSTKNQKDINLIVFNIYNGTRFKGEIVDDKGKLKLIYEGKVNDLSIINTGTLLKVTDKVNNKTTIIEYKTAPRQEVGMSLQDQILKQLKKKKMTDKEVIDFIKNLEKGIK